MKNIHRLALDLWRAKPVSLAVVAHPDDAEIYFGGQMLSRVDHGGRAFVLVATSGEKGCLEKSSPARTARIRKNEQKKAARLGKWSGVFFLDFPDGELEHNKRKLKERVTYFIRKLRPVTVFTFDPAPYYFVGKKFPFWGGIINHPDHRAVGEATLSAVGFGSGLANYYPEQLRGGIRPWPVQEIMLGATDHPNATVDIRPYLARKRALIGVYRSQPVKAFRKFALETERHFRRLVPSSASKP